MKNQFLYSIILATLFVFVSFVKLHADFSTPFSADPSFGGSGFSSPSDGRLPSDAIYERIINFSTGSSISPFVAGSNDINQGDGGTIEDPYHRNDAPIGNGLIALLCIAIMHTLVMLLRKKIISKKLYLNQQ